MSHVYTGGTFDLLHVGHLELLEACHRIAGKDGIVTVGLNTDDFVAQFKGGTPVLSFTERAALLGAVRFVDYVIPHQSGADSRKTIVDAGNLINKPVDVVAIGSDWARKDYYAQMGFTKEWLDSRNIILAYIDRRTGQSTTNIKGVIRNGRE